MLPALIRKAHEAKTRGELHLTVWGSGEPLREFLFADDLADACIFLMQRNYSGAILNIGTGLDVTIRSLAQMVCEVVRFDGEIVFDASKPDGTRRKLLDISAINDLGWSATTSLAEGIAAAYRDYTTRRWR